MSIKIRLAKTGKKNAPAFRIVVSQTRTKRNGKFLAVLGNFNPNAGGEPVIDRPAIDAWVKKGALLTEAVRKLLGGKYVYKKYDPKSEQTDDNKSNKQMEVSADEDQVGESA